MIITLLWSNYRPTSQPLLDWFTKIIIKSAFEITYNSHGRFISEFNRIIYTMWRIHNDNNRLWYILNKFINYNSHVVFALHAAGEEIFVEDELSVYHRQKIGDSHANKKHECLWKAIFDWVIMKVKFSTIITKKRI